MFTKELSPELQSHLIDMYTLALSDEDFDISERICLNDIAKGYGIDEQEIEKLLLSETRSASIPESIPERIQHLYDLARIAWADGVIKKEEKIMLRNFVLRYEFLEENSEAIVEYLLSSVQKGYSLEDITAEIGT